MQDFTDEDILREIQQRISRYTLFQIFNNNQIYHFLTVRGLPNFLSQIPSQILRPALENREQLEDRQAASSNVFRYNVLDFTIAQVIKHCYDNREIGFSEYQKRQEIYSFRNHRDLGMKLVQRFPLKYYVGQRSSHQTRAAELQRMYGLRPQRHTEMEQELIESHEEGSFIDEEGLSSFLVNDSEQPEKASEDDSYLDQSVKVNKRKAKRGRKKKTAPAPQQEVVKRKRGRPRKSEVQERTKLIKKNQKKGPSSNSDDQPILTRHRLKKIAVSDQNSDEKEPPLQSANKNTIKKSQEEDHNDGVETICKHRHLIIDSDQENNIGDQ